VSLFSGYPADPPSNDFIMRNSMDAQEVAVGWWPGDTRYGKAAFYAYAHPAPEGLSGIADLPSGAHWDAAQRLFILDWDDVRVDQDPHAAAVAFARTIFRRACVICQWDPGLAASLGGVPPPVH
jgi:hypothetical protein